MPITSSGRFVADAILVIEMEDVLVAKIQSGGAAISTSLKILSLTSISSEAASTTRFAFYADNNISCYSNIV